MKNKKSNNKEYLTSGNFAVASKRGFGRAVSICLLFAAIVFSSVFGVTGLFGIRGQNLAGESSVAYADNKSNHDKWLATVQKSLTDGSQETFKLDSDWVAEPKEKDGDPAADRYVNDRKRTEVGT